MHWMNQLVAWQAAVLSYTLFLIIDRRKIIMKNLKKIVAVALTVAMIVPTTVFGATSSEKKTAITSVRLAKSITYTGKTQKVTLTVKAGTKTLKAGSNGYKITSGSAVKTAGRHTVKVAGTGAYTGTKSYTYTVKAAKNSITASNKTGKAGRAVKIGAKSKFGKVKYTISSKYGRAGKTGVILKKGLKKGTKVTVKITVAKTSNYAGATKTIKVKVK